MAFCEKVHGAGTSVGAVDGRSGNTHFRQKPSGNMPAGREPRRPITFLLEIKIPRLGCYPWFSENTRRSGELFAHQSAKNVPILGDL